MALFNAIPPQMAVIMGKLVFSGSCTDVIGGTMTAEVNAGANTGSTKITWSPAFVSAPICIATINSGALTVTSPVARFTGIGTTTAYVVIADTNAAASGVTVGIMLIGEAKL